MEKVRIKTLVASMESDHSSDFHSELPDLRSPLCIAMEDADVLKAVLQVAAVGALLAAVSYAAYKAGEWLGLQIGGGSSGGGGSSVSIIVERQYKVADSVYKKHEAAQQNSANSHEMVEYEFVGFFAYIGRNLSLGHKLEKAMELCPQLLVATAEWTKGQGAAVADAITRNSSNPEDYRLNKVALHRLIDMFATFFSLLDIPHKNISNVVELRATYFQGLAQIHGTRLTVKKSRTATLAVIDGMRQHLKMMDDGMAEYISATGQLRDELKAMGKDMKKLSDQEPQSAPGIKTILNETNHNIQAGIALGTKVYSLFEQIAKDLGADIRRIDSALNKAGK